MSSNRQPETPRFGAFRKNNLPSSSSTNDTRRRSAGNAVYSLKVMQAKMASKKTGNTAQNEVFHQGFL